MSKGRKSPMATTVDAQTLERGIHQAGQQFVHVRVRLTRGHLDICPDEEPIARATPLGAGEYGLSFRRHTGKWERMPITGPLGELAKAVVDTLGPYLEKETFSDSNSGSNH
jgi:hypothetical protein